MTHKDSPRKQSCKIAVLAAIAEVGSIRIACHQAGISPTTFRRWRIQEYITTDEVIDARIIFHTTRTRRKYEQRQERKDLAKVRRDQKKERSVQRSMTAVVYARALEYAQSTPGEGMGKTYLPEDVRVEDIIVPSYDPFWEPEDEWEDEW